uniref:RAB44, member RAS oncogene family n=1 Tax=Nannospalax galili TaxID=1026970 RepID=A0A8C6W771_NANGA
MAFSTHMQEVLDAKEREVQRLTEGQRELEVQLLYLSSTQQEANSENQQLREAERDLTGQLEEVRGQLQVTRGHLNTARGRVSWQTEEEPSVPRANEKAPPEEAPLPGLFGDSDDWDQLLSSFGNHPHRTPQLSWSPPPTPNVTSSPQTPRVVRQISISKQPALMFGQEPASDPDWAPSSPTGVLSSPKDGKGVENTDRQHISPKQPVEPPGLEVKPEAHLLWSLSGAPAGELDSLGAAKAEPPLQGLSPPPQASTGSRKQFQASDPGSKSLGPGPAPAKLPTEGEALPEDLYAAGSDPGLGSEKVMALSERATESSQGLELVGQVSTEGPAQGEAGMAGLETHPGELHKAHGQIFRMDGPPAHTLQSPKVQPKAEEGNLGDRGQQDLGTEQAAEAHGLEMGNLESPQQDAQLFPPWSVIAPTSAEAEVPAPGKMSPSRSSPPMGAGSEAVVGTLLTLPELEAQPRPMPMSAQVESEPGAPQSREPGAESRSEKPGTDSEETGLTSSLGDLTQPQADPDYLFHVIFLGDSNVGKTTFLHLLHHDAFATGLTATVGVDFRVKNLLVDNKCFALQLWDTAGQERYHSLTRQLLRKAEGVVLMYDVTSLESFTHVRYWLDCLQDAGMDGAVILLLGNKMDCEEERQVPTEAGRHLAQELGVSFSECSAALGHNILEPIVNLTRSLKIQEDCLKESLVEVAPQRPPRRARCCS